MATETKGLNSIFQSFSVPQSTSKNHEDKRFKIWLWDPENTYENKKMNSDFSLLNFGLSGGGKNASCSVKNSFCKNDATVNCWC